MHKNDNELYIWEPDWSKRYTTITYPPVDDRGKEVDAYDGADTPPDTSLNLIKTEKGAIPDFLRDIGLRLYVSERAMRVISGYAIPGVRPVRMSLLDRKGKFLQRFFWLNICKDVELLDRSAGRFLANPVSPGRFKRIDCFVISKDRVPPDDLFLCSEIALPIATGRLVEAVRRNGLDGAIFYPLEGATWPVRPK